MNPFKYSDEKIDETELMIALPAVIIGVAILSLPREVASITMYNDGWVSILFGGIIFTTLTVMATKLAAMFPDKSFLDYTSYLVSKPIAIGLVWIKIVLTILLVSFATRSVAYISQQYLFEHTPLEVLALSFLLVVIYGVSGSRAGIFRLNMLFLPIILVEFFFVAVFNITRIETENYFPLFQTSMKDYLLGITKTFKAYIGFSIVLFYR